MPPKKLLVADDSLTIQKVIRLALSAEGYEIQTVSDGAEAEEALSLFRPDILLIDVSLPKKSAFELKDQMNREGLNKSVHCVLMSSAYDTIDEKKVKALGFNARLTKPFDPAHLRQVIEDVVPSISTKTSSTPPPFRGQEWAEDVSGRPEEEPQPATDSLWDEVIPLAKPQSPQEDDDIRELTQETIKMSGLDQFDWSVEDQSIRREELTIEKKPQRVSENQVAHLQNREPHYSPLPHHEEIDSTFELPPQEETDETPDGAPLAWTMAPTDKDGIRAEDPSPVPMNQAQIEELVRIQLQQTVLKMTKDLLPDIAEKIIKTEINKLLSNPPQN